MFEVVVTEKHREKAIEACNKRKEALENIAFTLFDTSLFLCKSCLMAQALLDMFPGEEITVVNAVEVNIDGHRYIVDDNGMRIIELPKGKSIELNFVDHWNSLSLPMTVQLEKVR